VREAREAAGQFKLIDGLLRRDLFTKDALVPVVVLELNDAEADKLAVGSPSDAKTTLAALHGNTAAQNRLKPCTETPFDL